MSDTGRLPERLALAAVDHVQPCPIQPRVNFSVDLIEQLSSSMRAGRHQPLLEVEPAPGAPGRHQIVCGEQRWRAAAAAGLTEVLVRLHRPLGYLARLEKQYEENHLRADLDLVEEAHCLTIIWNQTTASAASGPVRRRSELAAAADRASGQSHDESTNHGHGEGSRRNHGGHQRHARQVIAVPLCLLNYVPEWIDRDPSSQHSQYHSSRSEQPVPCQPHDSRLLHHHPVEGRSIVAEAIAEANRGAPACPVEVWSQAS